MDKMQVTIKNVFGKDLLYPACKVSEAFARAINTKTFNTHQITCAQQMGFTIVYVAATPSLAAMKALGIRPSDAIF